MTKRYLCTTRSCTMCKQVYLIRLKTFYIHHLTKEGNIIYRPRCCICSSKIAKQYNENNKEKQKQQRKRDQKKIQITNAKWYQRTKLDPVFIEKRKA